MLKSSVLKFVFGSLLMFSSCTDSTSIFFSCEKDKKNNYILKWEVFPEKDNAQINIYYSDNDSIFPNTAYANRPVNDYVAVISPSADVTRSFFRLKVGNTFSGIISNRRFEMDSIQNFRDLGGYFTRSNQQIRWGKIYRSGSLGHLSKADKDVLNALHIKTVIDLRNSRQIHRYPDLYSVTRYINIPINTPGTFDPEVKQRIMEGALLRGDAIILTQDTYREVIENYQDEYRRIFDVLSENSNYPVVFHCGLGKDRTGLVAYFLLKALDIPDSVIEEDFLLSNEGIDKFRLVNREKEVLSEKMQEAITIISKADISQLRFAIFCMKKRSGSVDAYMTNELGLTPKKRAKLKSILLY